MAKVDAIEIGGVKYDIGEGLSTRDNQDRDFLLCDDEGNALFQVNAGHIKTKKFDSKTVEMLADSLIGYEDISLLSKAQMQIDESGEILNVSSTNYVIYYCPIVKNRSYSVTATHSDSKAFRVVVSATIPEVGNETELIYSQSTMQVNVTFDANQDGYLLIFKYKAYFVDLSVKQQVVKSDSQDNNVSNISRLRDDIVNNIRTNGILQADGTYRDVPYTYGALLAYRKAHQQLERKFTAKLPFPNRLTDGDWSAGEYTSMRYSLSQENAKYVDWQVSERTFMTAVNNPYSLFYTERIDASHSKSAYGFTYHGYTSSGAYFGVVCSSFVGYALGFKVPYKTDLYPTYLVDRGDLVKVYDQSAQGIQLCDILYNSGHVRLITDIFRNERGEVVKIVVSESGSAFNWVGSTTYNSAQAFENNIRSRNTTIYRYVGLYKNLDYVKSAFTPVENEPTPTPYVYNDDICTYAGDYASFYETEPIWLNYAKGSYSNLKIYKNDTLVQTIQLDADSELHKINVTQYCNTYGKYKACLSGNTDSEFTYFEVVQCNTTHTITEGKSIVTFKSANATPLYVEFSYINGIMIAIHELTDEDIEEGSVTIDLAELMNKQRKLASITEDVYVRVYYRSEYGIVAPRQLTNYTH